MAGMVISPAGGWSAGHAGGVVVGGGGVGAGGVAVGGAGMAVGGAGAAPYVVAPTVRADASACCGTGPGGTTVCCGPGGAAACMTGEACSVTTGPAVMTFVGAGGGDYITETQYKYVGSGQGNLAMIAPKKSYMWAALLVVALILGVILYFVVTGPSTTTTAKVTVDFNPTRAACEFWGDPHIKTFDGARPSFYGNGEFWVVKHPQVWIQGRYEGTSWTHGLAATSRLAIAGPFLQGHKIEIGTMDSGILRVDGSDVMRAVGSSYSIPGIAEMTYSTQGNLVDDAQTEFPTRIVTINLPMNIKLEVMRWPNYMDFRITMNQMEGQDGSCGNFNRDPSDDKTEDIIARLGAQVHANDLLFDHAISSRISEEMQRMMSVECRGDQRSKAEWECRQESSENQREACMYDVCFGMNDHARKEALTFAD